MSGLLRDEKWMLGVALAVSGGSVICLLVTA